MDEEEYHEMIETEESDGSSLLSERGEEDPHWNLI